MVEIVGMPTGFLGNGQGRGPDCPLTWRNRLDRLSQIGR